MYKKYIKLLLDYIISIIACVILMPLFLIVSILIKLEDKGPIFYFANRIGQNSKKYNMIKFRSMKVNATDIRNIDGSTYNSNKDPRVTRTGKLLRETSIDEIPQIINVLKGEMSLIGPRASTWDALNSFQADEVDKMKVKPGISGYTQAYYRNGVSLRDKRLKDAWYANNVSFILDMRIFLKTIFTVINRENIYTNSKVDAETNKHDKTTD
ncbi:sugar transferase [Bacillus daqingensis]|uniref:Sugar transferase n=1 Tax=Bacillus daqingensis TaxID=872396 RepID=A0ABV9NX26_9BACI